jgi:hypothetical protein
VWFLIPVVNFLNLEVKLSKSGNNFCKFLRPGNDSLQTFQARKQNFKTHNLSFLIPKPDFSDSRTNHLRRLGRRTL